MQLPIRNASNIRRLGDSTIKRRIVAAAISTGLCVGIASQASAGPLTIVPSDLAPGATYYLAFVTDGVTTAASADISTYDAFVTQQADLNPALAAIGTTW